MENITGVFHFVSQFKCSSTYKVCWKIQK